MVQCEARNINIACVTTILVASNVLVINLLLACFLLASTRQNTIRQEDRWCWLAAVAALRQWAFFSPAAAVLSGRTWVKLVFVASELELLSMLAFVTPVSYTGKSPQFFKWGKQDSSVSDVVKGTRKHPPNARCNQSQGPEAVATMDI